MISRNDKPHASFSAYRVCFMRMYFATERRLLLWLWCAKFLPIHFSFSEGTSRGRKKLLLGVPQKCDKIAVSASYERNRWHQTHFELEAQNESQECSHFLLQLTLAPSSFRQSNKETTETRNNNEEISLKQIQGQYATLCDTLSRVTFNCVEDHLHFRSHVTWNRSSRRGTRSG